VAFWEELDRAADAESENSSSSWSDARHLLGAIERTETTVYPEDGAFTPEPTWGCYVFFTDYDQATRDNIPRAMES
jgi:hypothetical protein